MADHEPSLEDCPTEILLKILSYVGFSDIHQNFARTCKRFYEITRNPPKLYVLNLSMDGDGHANFNRELLKLHKDVKRVDVSMCNQEYLARWMQDNDGVHGRILQAGYYKHFTQIGHILDKLEHLSVKGTLNYLHPDKLRHLKSLDMSNCPYPTCSTQRTERGLESWLVKSLAQCHTLEDVRLNRLHIRTLADLSIRLMTRLKTLKVVQFYDDVNSLPHHEIISYYPDLFRTNRVRAAFYELGFFPFDPWSDKRHWKQLRDRIQTTLWTTLSDYCQLLTDVHLPYSEDCFITLSKLPNLTKVGINFRPYDWTQYNTYGRIAPDQRLKFKSQVIQQMTFHNVDEDVLETYTYWSSWSKDKLKSFRISFENGVKESEMVRALNRIAYHMANIEELWLERIPAGSIFYEKLDSFKVGSLDQVKKLGLPYNCHEARLTRFLFAMCPNVNDFRYIWSVDFNLRHLCISGPLELDPLHHYGTRLKKVRLERNIRANVSCFMFCTAEH